MSRRGILRITEDIPITQEILIILGALCQESGTKATYISYCNTVSFSAAAAAAKLLQSDSVRPHTWQSTRLHRPWGSFLPKELIGLM